jgi:signal peptidase II
LRVLYLSLSIVFADQISKIFVKGFSIPFLKIYWDGMYEGQRIKVIGNFFRITFIENPGMAFGFNPGTNFKLFISLFSLIASIGLVVYLYYIRNSKPNTRIAIACILGGAIGNLIDRMFYGVVYGYAPLFYGRVVDFLDFDFFHFSLLGRVYDRFPIFNFADASVTIGVFILILFHNKFSPASENSEPEVTASPGNVSGLTENLKEENNKLSDGQSDKGKESSL